MAGNHGSIQTLFNYVKWGSRESKLHVSTMSMLGNRFLFWDSLKDMTFKNVPIFFLVEMLVLTNKRIFRNVSVLYSTITKLTQNTVHI